MRNLRCGWRSLGKNPTVSAAAVLTLALAIGANTAIFSVVKAVLLNPLPYRDAGQLVTLAITTSAMPDNALVDPFTAADWRARSRSFESLSLYGDASTVMMESGEGEIVRGLRVNWNFFDTLGVKMDLGRAFLPEEDRPDRRFTVVILSHGFWMRHFGGDPTVLGRVVELGGFHYTVTGVLPATFEPLLHGTTELLPEIYMPAGIDYSSGCRRCLGPRAIARLKPGVTVDGARAELAAVMRGIVREHPADYDRNTAVRLMPLREFLFGRVNAALWPLLGAAGFVLLIACANVGHFLLAGATARAREMAVRAALGAGRWDLIGQLLTESLLLALAGGTAGLLLAYGGMGTLAGWLPRQIPRVEDVRIDAAVLTFSFGISMLAALVCGLAPAWHGTRIDLNEALKSSGQGGGNRSRHGVRSILVATEMALAFALVGGAGLMVKSFARLMNVNPGYEPRNVLTLSSNVWGPRYESQAASLSYYERSLEQVRAVEGIEGAAWTSMLPLDAADRERLHVQGRAEAGESDAPLVERYSVSTEYFQVMKIPLKRGRVFTSQDTATTPRVALISESCARRQFPGEDPIGKQIRFGDDPRKPWATIVGVVGDIRQYGLDRPPNMEVYVAQAQDVIIGYYRLVARTAGPPLRMERGVRAAFASVDHTLPVYHVKSLEEYVNGTLAPRTVTLTLLGLFSILAVVLAGAGVYAVVWYAAGLRRREIGIRMALGAGGNQVIGLVIREGLRPAMVGLAAGIGLSPLLDRFLTSLLFEVRPTDWGTAAGTMVVLASAALAGAWGPARRAARLDAAVVLREE